MQWQWLHPCLVSLTDNPYTLGEFEIVVVDNASGDGTPDRLEGEFPSVRVIAATKRRGFAANQNMAARAARGDILYVLNPDTLIGPGVIDALVEAFSTPGVVLASGPIQNTHGLPWTEAPFEFPTARSALLNALGFGILRRARPAHAGVFSDRWVSGSAFCVDRESFLRIGGFDEDFFMYGEEVDLMRRLLGPQRLLAWVAESVITHVGQTAGGSTSDTELLTHRATQLVRGELLYAHKNLSRWNSWVMKQAIIVDAAIRALASSIPGTRTLVTMKGTNRRETRLHHLARLRAAARPNTAVGLEELADAWNANHPE
jgi:GT2 family glycosyltransferase